MAGRRIYNIDDNFFDKMSSEKYWLIGLFAADGYVSSESLCGISQAGEYGKKMIEYVKELMHSTYPISSGKTSFKGSSNIQYGFDFSSKKIVQDLEKYNVVKRKTYTFSFPEIIPEEFIPAFLCGYVEGDGSILTYGSKSDYSKGGIKDFLVLEWVGTEKFIKRCNDVVPVKGFIGPCKGSNVWIIRWYSYEALQVCGWLYNFKDIYRGSYKFKNFIKAKNSYYSSSRVKSSLDREKLLDSILSKEFVSVGKYAKDNPEHSESVYYGWLNAMCKEGLIDVRDYKCNRWLDQIEYNKSLESKLLNCIKSGKFTCVRDFVVQNGIQNDYEKCYGILRDMANRGIIDREVYVTRNPWRL